jgi:NADH-quinone oxidoreductase subunit J
MGQQCLRQIRSQKSEIRNLMNPLLFWLFAFLMLAFGVSVVVNRSPVASALSLVVCFLCLAALYVGLDAYVLGAIQVVVYAGAVMVLFLFIIMLLDLKSEQRRKFNKFGVVGGALVALAFAAQVVGVLGRFPRGNQPLPALNLPPGESLDDLQRIGESLFSAHTLPFQIVGVLILVATVGVVVISKRELK